jgi:peptidoglycan/LPS O-acetylase OafA/YrhL
MTSQPMMTASHNSSRLPELDGIRGIAAVLVVYGHLLVTIFATAEFQRNYRILLDALSAVNSLGPMLASGHASVIAFLVLSGFVLGPTLTHIRDIPSYARYALGRVSRIWIPYAASLLVALVLAATLTRPASAASWPAALRIPWTPPFTAETIVCVRQPKS